MVIADQHQHWNHIYERGEMNPYAMGPTELAQEMSPQFNKESSILELGCGLGHDSSFFATKKHSVIGIDFSEVAIANAVKKRGPKDDLNFQIHDMTRMLPFMPGQFDVVYARLSLNYFTDSVTKQVFSDIYRVMAPKSMFCFICKSIDDPLYRQGEMMEKDLYIRQGHIRRFFTEEYAKECLSEHFIVQKIESGKAEFFGYPSAYVKVIATNK
jgi:SAM-dependent methyltransferase